MVNGRVEMMCTGNVVQDKSFRFAIRIVNVYKHLVKEQKEYVLVKQVLRSGISVGANANEAQSAQSKADFIAKMSIASKEARETEYWIRLLISTGYLDQEQHHVQTLLEESTEISKLLTSIVKTAQQKERK